jgi:hypothetical protein
LFAMLSGGKDPRKDPDEEGFLAEEAADGA